MKARKSYPSDVSDEEWSFVTPYLVLMREAALQRQHSLRELFNALRWLVRAGAPWRMLPNDFSPWPAIYQQMRRWLKAGCFEAIVHDLRSMLRVAQGRQAQPSPAQWCWMDARCNRAVKADRVQATTGISAKKAAKFIWQWIPWDIYWLFI